MVDGRAPSTRERLLLESAATLAPHQSLDRIDSAAAVVTAAVTVAGTLAAGFGTVVAGRLADVGIGWSAPTVVLVALALVLAILASVPAAGVVPPGDTVKVEAFFRAQIRRRGMLVRSAGCTLAAAILLAPLPLVAAAGEHAGAAIDLTAQTSGDARVVHIEAVASGLSRDGSLTVRARAGSRLLGLAVADAGADGSATATIRLAAPSPGVRLALEAVSTRPPERRVLVLQLPTDR